MNYDHQRLKIIRKKLTQEGFSDHILDEVSVARDIETSNLPQALSARQVADEKAYIGCLKYYSYKTEMLIIL